MRKNMTPSIRLPQQETKEEITGILLVLFLKPSDDLRIYGDNKTNINKWMVNCKYPLPMIGKICAFLHRSILFSKLDFSIAYNKLFSFRRGFPETVIISTILWLQESPHTTTSGT